MATGTAIASLWARQSTARSIRGLLTDPRRALCAAVAVIVASVGLDALGDPDVWWHLRLGDWIAANRRIPTTELFSYTAQGHPLVAHEWLSDSVFALLAGAGGLATVALLMGAVAWSGLIAVALRGRARGAGPYAIAVGLALGAKAAQPVLGTRPQVFTVALVCWTLWIAETYLRSGGRRHWLLPPLLLLWANLHAGFVAGLGLLALLTVVELIRARVTPETAPPPGRVRGLAVAVGVAALAACVNPVGPSLYRFALATATSEGQKAIVEWQSPNFHDPSMWALLALLVTFAALPALGGRLDMRDAVFAIAGIGLALLAVRNTAVCVALVTPAWMALASAAGRTDEKRAGRKSVLSASRGAPAAVGVAMVAAGVLTTVYSGARVAAAASSAGIGAAYPACATAVLARAPAAQRVFTTYGTAGYVIDRLWPRALVYEYGESISLGRAVFDHYQRIAAGAVQAPTALQLLTSSGTTAVLFPRGDLTAELDATRAWTRVLSDHGLQLYVKGNPSWAARASCAPS